MASGQDIIEELAAILASGTPIDNEHKPIGPPWVRPDRHLTPADLAAAMGESAQRPLSRPPSIRSLRRPGAL